MTDVEDADRPTKAGLVPCMGMVFGAKAMEVSETMRTAIEERINVLLDRVMLSELKKMFCFVSRRLAVSRLYLF